MYNIEGGIGKQVSNAAVFLATAHGAVTVTACRPFRLKEAKEALVLVLDPASTRSRIKPRGTMTLILHLAASLKPRKPLAPPSPWARVSDRGFVPLVRFSFLIVAASFENPRNAFELDGQ